MGTFYQSYTAISLTGDSTGCPGSFSYSLLNRETLSNMNTYLSVDTGNSRLVKTGGSLTIGNYDMAFIGTHSSSAYITYEVHFRLTSYDCCSQYSGQDIVMTPWTDIYFLIGYPSKVVVLP